MTVTLRKTLLIVILALLLLTMLIGQSLSRSSHAPVQRHAHTLAFVCPPPPFECI